jgi:2-polyprenyl-6-methoxyphenol hydroxylase-like FAD-dependent oxidoreductase
VGDRFLSPSNGLPSSLVLRSSTLPVDSVTHQSPQLSGKNANVIVVGAGPAGLTTAIMLARRGYTSVKVYERLLAPPPPNDAVWDDFENPTSRNYNIGVSLRGQKAMTKLEVLDKIDSYSAKCVGRMEWSPETKGLPKETISKGKIYDPKIIQRERLASCLLEEIHTKYNESVSVSYETECTNLEWKENKDDEICLLKFVQKDQKGVSSSGKEWTEESRFVIGADGAASAVRKAMVSDGESKKNGFFVRNYEDKNVRVYKTIPLHFPKGVDKNGKKWRGDLNYSVRTKSDINIDALPTKEGPYYGVVLYRPWDERMNNMKTGSDAKAFFDEVLPMFSSIVRDGDLERFAQQKESKLPRFSYVGPVLHRGQTTCLLGDCIHTVKPYFGIGVNSGFEDVMVLDDALNSCNDDIPSALVKYSELRAKDTEAVVKVFQRLDGGFFSFVFPLIIDGIFNGIAPAIFTPNILRSMQDPTRKFSEVKNR